MARKKAIVVNDSESSKDINITKFPHTDVISVPFGAGDSILVDIRETLQDRRSGTRSIETMWGDKPNLAVIVDELSKSPIRTKVAEFFLTRKLEAILIDLVPTHTVKPGERIFTAPAVMKALTAGGDQDIAIVVSEFLIPFFRKLNMIAEAGNFTREVYYDVKQVTIQAVTEDIVAQEVVRVAEAIDTGSFSDAKYTKETFAAAVANALVAIGDGFLNINIYSDLFDDIVKGIRAKLYIGRATTHIGDVPKEWRDNPVVRDLSSNYVFVKAAVQLPIGTSLSPTNQMYRLEERAPLALAALRQSQRYAFVGKDEFVRTFGKKTLRDTKRIPRAFVGWRAARPAAVAQSVTAFKDAVLPGIAMNVSSADSNVEKFLAAGYSDTSRLGTDTHAKHLTRMTEHAIESGFKPDFYGYSIAIGNDPVGFTHELVCLLSKEVRLVAPARDALDLEGPLTEGDMAALHGAESQWVFGMQTNEAFLDNPVSDGKFQADMFFTNNIGEALLVAPDFEPSAEMELKPQLLSPKVIKTRLLGFENDDALQPAGIRISFDVEVGGIDIRGSIRTEEIAYLATTQHTYVVKPKFNAEVIAAVASIFDAYKVLLKDIKAHNDRQDVQQVPAATIDFIRRQRGVMLIEMARGVSKTYRHAVHQAIASKALRNMSAEDAILGRGQISQQQFGGYADVFALIVFLATQGIAYDFAIEVVSNADMVPVLMEYGTDRA